MNVEQGILSYLDGETDVLGGFAKDIWDHPQIALLETYASKKIADELERAGFSVKRDIGTVHTAFVASWGKGEPIIGILGEFDALPGLSQKVSAKKEAIEQGGPGHGCGHNLLGVGSLGAALALKQTMEKNGVKGTIRYYGCPAEETLLGKVFMARAGVFDDLDAAVSWHPMNANTCWGTSSLAMNSFKLNFHGVSAHAAASPEQARSALDGVVLTDVGVNYLREHIPQEARIHCVITNGGMAPNVVPAEAAVWYFVRAPHRDQVEGIYARVLDIAKGAALMTGTTFDVDFLCGCYDYLSNDAIGKVMSAQLKKIGGPKFTEEEKTFAAQLQATLPPTAVEVMLRGWGVSREEVGDPLSEKVSDNLVSMNKGTIMPGSTDVGDVSYITPTAQLTTCCLPLGVPTHSWQSTASMGSTIGFKGMMVAAKVMALTALDLLTQPQDLAAAKEEFKKATGGKKYITPLPEGVVAHS